VRKTILQIIFFLLLTTLSSAYGGTCSSKPFDIFNCKLKANQGDVGAQYALGTRYIKGIGVSRDYKQAVKWYRKAAKQGAAEAQYVLGRMNLNGDGTPKNGKQAAKWFRKAAEQGHVRAQHKLGAMYVIGYGVPQHYKKAVKWLRKASEKGHPLAQYNLGDLYAFGNGVPLNNVTAHMLFNISAVNGNVDAFQRRDSLGQRMSLLQVEQAQRLAAEWIASH